MARFVRRMAFTAVLFGAVFGGAASGCNQERDPIDRTQPNGLPKSFFVGQAYADAADDPEFYMKTTVVDVSAGAGSEELFTNSDAQPTVRIRWEVAEKQLVARLSYELIDDTDHKGASKKVNDGQVVAAFRIDKQFDLRREYNPSTGEENNVVVENDFDRPWFSRDWIRVDWSENLVTSAYSLDAISQLGLFGGVKWESLRFMVADTDAEDRMTIDKAGGYFDVTVKAQAKPQMISDPELGDFPACWLLDASPRESCDPSEVKLRMSFRKVVDHDYEPLDFDGQKMDLFGYFSSDRRGYDRRYGLVDDKWHRFATRWNIWEKSHTDVACNSTSTTPGGQSPHRDDDQNGTEDECQTSGPGSRCDEFTQKCTIPFAARKVVTIPWYVNKGFPEELIAGARKVVGAWNDAMRVSVVAARLAECRRVGEQGCEAKLGWPEAWADDYVPAKDAVADVFVLCHNPSNPETDPAICGKGVAPRLGDLRYNLFSLIESPQLRAPWGIMMDSDDPLTGEKVAGSVNQYGATLDRAASNLTDIVELLNGGISPDAFIQGQDVSSWVSSTKSAPKAMGKEELQARLGAFDPSTMGALATGKTKSRLPPKLRFKRRLDALAASGHMGAGNPAMSTRLRALGGSELEAKLLTPEMLQVAGQKPDEAASPTAVLRASPFRTMNPLLHRAIERRRKMGRLHSHSCVREAPEPDHLLGLARNLLQKFPAPDRKNPKAVLDYRTSIFQWAKEHFAVGVFSHEFGHSVGLRHNFAGTFDALNYAQEYWQLRTKNGTVTQRCTPGNTDGASCVGPRYQDPITQEEINGQIGSFATSSVMDYPGDAQLDMFLMGKYDKAAVRFAYAGVVDVWNAKALTTRGFGEGKRKAYALTGLTEQPGLFAVPYLPTPGGGDYAFLHYSHYASEYELISNCGAAGDSPTGIRCKEAPMDVVDYRDTKDFVADPNYPDVVLKRAIDAGGRVRRGYIFSSDEFSDSGNVPSFSTDAGADAYEQARFIESAYENRYIFDHFRRGRSNFNSYDVTTRTQLHYLDTLQQIAKTFGFAMVLETEDPQKPDPALLEEGRYGPLSLASTVAFDTFGRNLVRPEPGSYCDPANPDCLAIQPVGVKKPIFGAESSPFPGVAYDFKLGLGAGRFVHNDFDYGQGYWWSDYQKQVGSFYDKVWAIYYLSEAFDTFIANSREDFIDGRYKNVNFATVYPAQVRRLFANILTGDVTTYAPWAAITGGGATPNAEVVYPPFRDNAAMAAARPGTLSLVNPTFGFNEQLYAMVWGSIFFATSWTTDFMQDTRIASHPTDLVSWPADATYTFVDPLTNLAYRAHTVGTEKVFGVDHQIGIGARMLEWANELLALAYVVQRDGSGNVLKNTDGTPILVLTGGKPTLDTTAPAANAALRRFVTNLEVMRQLSGQFAGPFLGELP